ncbi:uncharacterized protein LOC120448436 [Drosophila santomea]|uniref:uncharacterized protein LOC120448436 n=1 Tax=Drosophila santomea TaxID=129105 RepID=UPI001953933B|nr:uncharacterized protein LOC120448436 [Drosophila santomea]
MCHPAMRRNGGVFASADRGNCPSLDCHQLRKTVAMNGNSDNECCILPNTVYRVPGGDKHSEWTSASVMDYTHPPGKWRQNAWENESARRLHHVHIQNSDGA